MDAEILTLDEAAALLKVAPEIVLNLLLTSEIPGRSIGGEWRTTKRALVSFIDGVPLQMGCCGPDMCCTPGASGRGCC
jgi:hypothetical protein